MAPDAESWITPEKTSGKADHLAQPVGHAGLELGRGGRGLPEHALRRERGSHVLGHDGGRARIGREIGEEARMLPMGHPRHDDPVEIGEDRLHRSSPAAGGRGRDLAEGVAGAGLGPHRPRGHALEIVRRPVGRAVRPVSEFVRVHVSSSALVVDPTRPAAQRRTPVQVRARRASPSSAGPSCRPPGRRPEAGPRPAIAGARKRPDRRVSHHSSRRRRGGPPATPVGRQSLRGHRLRAVGRDRLRPGRRPFEDPRADAAGDRDRLAALDRLPRRGDPGRRHSRGEVARSRAPGLQVFRSVCLVGSSSLLFVAGLQRAPARLRHHHQLRVAAHRDRPVHPAPRREGRTAALGGDPGRPRRRARGGAAGIGHLRHRPAIFPILSATCWAAASSPRRRLGGIDGPWTAMTYTAVVGTSRC